MVFLELQQETWCSSQVIMGTSGTSSCCLRKVTSPCEFQRASQDSCPVGARSQSSSGVEAGTSEFLSMADMDLGVPLGRPQVSQTSSLEEPCKFTLLSIRKSSVSLTVRLTIGIIGFL